MKSLQYDLVMLWAYEGILIKHTSESGFSGQYPAVIYTVIVCMIIFVIVGGYVVCAILKGIIISMGIDKFKEALYNNC